MTSTHERCNARRPMLTGVVLSAMVASMLAGCAGHGRYTSEQINRSRERMQQMRAANEWDMARQAFLAGELDKALTRVNNSLALADDVPKSHVLKGRIHLERGEMDAARESLLKAETIDQENIDAQYYLGIVEERGGNAAQAAERYAKASELDPGSAQYAIAAAEMMVDTGRLDDAERFLAERNSRFQHHAGVRQTLGHIAMLRGDSARAAEMFNEARLLAPDDLQIVEDLARAQFRIGRLAESEVNLARLLSAATHKDRRDLMHLRAECMVALDRPVDARNVLLALVRTDEGAADADAWNLLGKVAFTLRDQNNLRQASQRVVALRPEQWDGYVLRALWQRRQGDLRAALGSAAEGVRRRGASVEPLVVRGMIQEELGHLQAARESFAQALAEQPSNEPAGKLLARLDERLGNPTAEARAGEGE